MLGRQRNEIAKVLKVVAEDGLPGPRDLDAALDHIESIMEVTKEEADDILQRWDETPEHVQRETVIFLVSQVDKAGKLDDA